MRLLEAQGYRCTRSGASLGAWDIVAIGPRDVVLVQVKCNRAPGAAELSRLVSFPVPPGVHRVVHRWIDGEREPDVRVIS